MFRGGPTGTTTRQALRRCVRLLLAVDKIEEQVQNNGRVMLANIKNIFLTFVQVYMVI